MRKYAFLLALAVWYLLIHPIWSHPDQRPLPQWTNFGGYVTQNVCESFRKRIIAEQKDNEHQPLMAGSICIQDTDPRLH